VNADSEYVRSMMGARSLVGAFDDRESAHQAARALRDEGFHKIWIGLTRPGSNELRSDDESIGERIGRFFRGGSDGGSLIETLMHHGVSVSEAERVERTLAPNDVVLTVDGSNHPELAAQIIESHNGDVLSGESFVYTSVDWDVTDERLGSELLGYQNPDEFARGKRIDDVEVTRLRNERLLAGTAPSLHEDVFVSRPGDVEVRETGRRRR
jgi:hypothetical protein